MAFVHGRNTVIKINAVDLSAFTKTTAYNRSIKTHDVTTYGKLAENYAAGLLTGKVTIGGVYDSGASGPRGTLRPLLVAGALVTFLFQPEGSGTGKPQDSVSVLVESYNESNPVADMIAWTCELQMSDVVTTTVLP